MSDPGKKSTTSPRKSLETLVEHGDNDVFASSTGGAHGKGDSGSVDSKTFSRKHLSGSAVSEKQTMQTSSSSDVSDKDDAIRRSFHAQLSRSFFQSRSMSSSSVDGGSPSPSKSRHGTVPVEDPITHESVVNSKVLLLYTGGALGWKVDPADLEGIKNINKNNVTSCFFVCFFRGGGGEVLKGNLGVVVPLRPTNPDLVLDRM